MFWTGLIYNKSCKIKNLVFISIQQNWNFLNKIIK
jgi:hypothetical protein